MAGGASSCDLEGGARQGGCGGHTPIHNTTCIHQLSGRGPALCGQHITGDCHVGLRFGSEFICIIPEGDVRQKKNVVKNEAYISGMFERRMKHIQREYL